MNTKLIMTQAWNEARAAAKKFGGRASEFFRECLRNAWKTAKCAIPSIAGLFELPDGHNTDYKTLWIQKLSQIGEQVIVDGVVAEEEFWDPKEKASHYSKRTVLWNGKSAVEIEFYADRDCL